MKKIMSIALTLIMTVSICFGCFGSVYAATPDKITVTKAFSDCSWSEISEYVGMAEQGKINLSTQSVWSVGDTKDVTLTTGETIQLQIADFNHDTFEDGTTAPVSLIMKDCLAESTVMIQVSPSTGGSSTESNTKSSSENHMKVAEKLIYDILPTDLKAIVAPVKKKCYMTYNDASSLSEESYNIWLLSEAEVFGSVSYTVGSDEGTQYPIFTDNASRIKQYSWGLRSLYLSSTNSLVSVNSDGSVGYCRPNMSIGVLAGLCIRGTSDNTNIIDVTVPESISLTADAEGNFSKTYTFANSGNVSLNIKGTVNMANGWELVESESGKVYKDVKKVSLCMNNVDIATIKHDTVSDTDIGGDFDAGESIDVTISGRTALSSEALQNVNIASFNFTITPR